MNRDAEPLLCRALERSADAAAVVMTIGRAVTTRWASATFAGARHELVLALSASPAIADWLAGLPEADLPLRGHLVADLKVVGVASGPNGSLATIEVLTVEER